MTATLYISINNMQIVRISIVTFCLLLRSSAVFSRQLGVSDIMETLIFRQYNNISHTVFLQSAGKGTVGFAIMPLHPSLTSFRITVGQNILTVNDRDVSLSGPYSTVFKLKNEKSPACSLTHPDKTQYLIWVSISARRPNAFIKVGYGYRMACNVLTSFVAPDTRYATGLQASLAHVTEISIDERVNLACSPELCGLPVILQPSPFLELNRPDIHTNTTTFFPQLLDFPQVLQRLHEYVNRFVVTDSVLAGINFSLDTEGCLLHSMLHSKPGSFGGDTQSTYIRVPLRESTVTSPGQEIVLEIWPKGHSSPIHNHGNSAAMIKVLQGTLKSEWYNPLVNVSSEQPQLIQTGILNKGNITWMLPHLFQTHRLVNERQDLAAITIQAYGYVDGAKEMSDVFRYVLPDDSTWHQFYPNVDVLYPELESRVLEELQTGHCRADFITEEKHTTTLAELEVRVRQLEEQATAREEQLRWSEETVVNCSGNFASLQQRIVEVEKYIALKEAASLPSRGIAWNGNWAFACEFLGGDMGRAETAPDECGPTCEATPGCTHFTYYLTAEQGCWMKKGSVTKADAHEVSAGGVICGIMANRAVKSVEWNGNNWAFGCDIPGGNLTEALTSGADCGGTCAATSGCTHFIWTPVTNTCYMKQGLVTQQDAVVVANQQVVCGILQ